MTNWLIRVLVRNHQDTRNRKVRASYGTLGSVTGIVVNVLLAALKFMIGLISGSLAVTADAVNNLSDSMGSLMSLITVRMAVKPNDKAHPFGHGRMEYIGALAVGVIIVIAGFQLLTDGIKTIIQPEAIHVSLAVVALLVFSVAVKLWLFYFYRKIARRIDSKTLFAAAKDSLSDIVATSAVIISIMLQWIFGWMIDGYIGVVVALFVLHAGYSVCKDTIDSLLGGKPDPYLIEEIQRIMLEKDAIYGLHDLILHDYGPGRCIASVHAEVSASSDIVAVHDVIDQAERELKETLGIEVVIHMDPIVTRDPTTNALRQMLSSYLHDLDSRLSMHDFRVIQGEERVSLMFDCLLPDETVDQKQLLTALKAFVKQLDPRYELVVQFDLDFS